MEWAADIVTNPLVDKSFAVVLVFLLLRFLREDLRRLTDAIEGVRDALGTLRSATDTLHQEMSAQSAHQTNRMNEIREAILELYRGHQLPPKRRGSTP